MDAALLSSDRQDWRTPEEIVELVRQVFGGSIACDPCGADGSVVGARYTFGPTSKTDGLELAWSSPAYVNPPYAELGQWMGKCEHEWSMREVEIIALIPARTDTVAFHNHAFRAPALCFWQGRLTFLGAPHPAPFPSALVYWGDRIARFRHVFEDHGVVVVRS